ncbi:MAG: sulfurtransferase-like selenium metabolism protein YedF [Geobacteraceae bacterium]|nr:sulfurtransferase-like selenium metabolism protein YedF [Geobacteraceae bacterium]
MKVIDCRGMACPGPVISTRNALEESSGESIRVILDNGAPLENVIRFCNSKGCDHLLDKGESCATLTIFSNPLKQQPTIDDKSQRIVLVASDKLGSGSDELGRLLLKNFFITLIELPTKPQKIFFINSGVLLTSQGSELLEALEKLAMSDVEILSCGICLDYYGIKEKLSIGVVTNMYSIAESILTTGNLIRI